MTTTQPRTFRTATGDPLNVLQYTLSNGLKLYLSVNPFEPRIFTNIAVRAGSKQDPADTTGLAHYMEHLLFKGTNRIGALDWEQEKVLLARISELYEQHRFAETEEERLRIYAEIDRVSNEAAPLAAANEYDKLSGAIGADQTNAYTWLDQTVYVNEIPCNELERWMQLESERFRMMALRLFHTELETVYEEFNISQDRDFRKVGNALRALLYPTHPYGTQTTLGSAEHLKRPSQINIQRFFQTYYVPNNMALLLAGDFNPEEVVDMAERYFGSYMSKPVPPFEYEQQAPIAGPLRREVFGQEGPYVQMAWRFGPAAADEQVLLSLTRRLLFNHQAGLLDTRLNQTQLVLESEAWSWPNADYTAFGLYAKPREGQTLEEAEQLLLQQIAALRNGDWEDSLLEAVVKDYELEEWKALESNAERIARMAYAFINGLDWEQMVRRLEEMRRVSKQEIIAFVNEHLLDNNYVAVYKRQGPDLAVLKVEKPPITAVTLNREGVSEFAADFLSRQTTPIAPVFESFGAHIQTQTLSNGLSFDYVYNPANPLFRLDYIFEMGKTSDPALAVATNYLPYLGDSQRSAVQIKQELFRLGLSFDATCNDERTYITLSGLEESFEAGLRLLEDLLSGVKNDAYALSNIVSDTLLKRRNAKQDRNVILRDAMGSYARYGPESPFTFRLSEAELHALHPGQLTQQIRTLNSFAHRIYYYGQKPGAEVARLLEKYHHPELHSMQPVPEAKAFAELDTPQHQVLFVDFPIVQADVLLVSKGSPVFNPEELLFRDWYNEYFGYGLSSIVFQEIREAKALAYSTYAMYSTPTRKDRAHYLRAYVGTQPDKLADALPALLNIIEHMPVAEAQVEHARQSLLKRIATERVLPSHLYWTARSYRDLGIGHDFRRDIYERLQTSRLEDLLAFQQQYVKGRAFTFLVLGSRERIDMELLASFGPVRELSMEEVFGY